MGNFKLRLKEFLIGGIAAMTVFVALSSTVHAAGSTTMYFQDIWPKVYGSQMMVQVRINTNGDHVNTAEADFTYPTNMLQFVSIDSASSSAFTVNASTTGGGGSVSMQTDGNLVVRSAQNNVLWVTNTAGHNGSRLVMQTYGNLIVRSAQNKVLWVKNTSGHNGSYLIMQTDSNLVIRTPANVPIWTRTHGRLY